MPFAWEPAQKEKVVYFLHQGSISFFLGEGKGERRVALRETEGRENSRTKG